MSRRPEQSPTAGHLWRRNALIWAALLGLLMLSLAIAYVPMGAFTTAAGIVIAAIKSTLVMMLFMELATSKPLIRVVAICGMFLLIVMFALTLADILARP